MDYIILTATNNAFINTTIDFINCYELNFNNLIIYNLDLNQENLQKILELQKKNNFQLKNFDFNLYPEHVNFHKFVGLNCSYAFKPIIIYNEAINDNNKNKIIIWMDSANRFNKNQIENIYNIVKLQGIYTPISAYENTIETIELNNHRIVNLFGLTKEEHMYKLKSISAGLFGINYNSNAGQYILNQWYKDSLDKNKICPEGTNRNNNRQDQTILSLIIYLYEKNNNINFNYYDFGVRFWVKKDKSTIDPSLQPYKLIEKQNGKQLAIIYCKNIGEAIKTYADRKNIDVREFLQNYNVIN